MAAKLQEFVAHGSAVNCLQFGRKSGAVMVTGGEDKKVNVWAIGRPNAILSLTGHTSSVECVTFDSNESTVIAGSAGGTLKLWDLEQAKVARTLTGHRSNCISVQWHPYGEFFASGSVDTNLKIWDIRRKSCIQTYKGHTRGVRQIAFSPDGRWVVSGGDDGVVKLWDLTAGRLVHEFAPHSAPISGLAMHPTEFLMASASVDRTLRLWDLESFEQVCCMPPDSGQIRRVMFSEDGSALLSGAEESLRVWGWEPVRCYEQTDVRWSRLADLCTSPGQQKLLAGSVREAIVSVWNIDLTAIQPFASATHPAEQRQPPVRSPRPAAASPMGGRRVQSDATPPPAQRTAQTQRLDAPEPAATPAQKRDASRGMGNPDEAVRQQIAQCRAQLAQRRASQGQGATAPSHLSHCPTSCASASIAEAPPPEAFSASGNHASVGTSMTDTLDGRAPAVNPDGLLTAPPPSKPQHRAPAEAKRGADMCGDDHDILRLLTHGNERQEACLHSRLDALRTLHTFWQAGQVKQMLQRLQQLEDPSVTYDVVAAGIIKGASIDLECVLVLLPLLMSLLDSTYEDVVLTAMRAVSHLSLSFGPLIKNTRGVAQDMLGVDLNAEARRQRCQAAYEHFSGLIPRLKRIAPARGSLGSTAKDLLATLSAQLDL